MGVVSMLLERTILAKKGAERQEGKREALKIIDSRNQPAVSLVSSCPPLPCLPSNPNSFSSSQPLRTLLTFFDILLFRLLAREGKEGESAKKRARPLPLLLLLSSLRPCLRSSLSNLSSITFLLFLSSRRCVVVGVGRDVGSAEFTFFSLPERRTSSSFSPSLLPSARSPLYFARFPCFEDRYPLFLRPLLWSRLEERPTFPLTESSQIGRSPHSSFSSSSSLFSPIFAFALLKRLASPLLRSRPPPHSSRPSLDERGMGS